MRSLLLLPVAALVLLAMTACDTPLVMHERSGTEAGPGALQHAWSTPATQPDWVPADAAGIRFLAKTAGPADETPAVVLVASGGALPASCIDGARPARPALAPSWVPQHLPSRVEICGNWAVVPVRGGWFGWTPAAASGA